MHLRKWLSALLLLTATGCFEAPDSFGTVPEAAKVAPLHFGVLPALDAGTTKRKYGALAQEAGRTIGRPVEIVVGKSYAELVAGLSAGSIQLAQLSPYMVLRAELEKQILVIERKSVGTDYSGVFIVREDSPFKSVRDLAGKRFLFVNEESSAGYFYPRMRLRELGFDPNEHFGKTEFAGSHKRVAQRVSKGEADGGAVSWWTLPEALNLRVVERTDPIPDDAIVYAANLTDAERKVARDFFLAAHENPRLSAFLSARSVARYVEPKRRK